MFTRLLDTEVISFASAKKFLRPMKSPCTDQSWDSFNNYDIGYNPLLADFAAGGLSLPPSSVKDPEMLLELSHVYIVLQGQPKSVELAFGNAKDDPRGSRSGFDDAKAEHFLLSPGDVFVVPPCNSYRIENHSASTECVLAWLLVRTIAADKAALSLNKTLSTIRGE